MGCFLSFFLALGAPYANMILRSTYMAADISTPGAIFIFLLLIGVLNLAFKLAARSREMALVFALLIAAAWLFAYWPLDALDPHSPGVIFSTFALLCAIGNLPLVWSGRSLFLNRAELIMVYAMLGMVSAVCTMGLSEQLLPKLTAIFYYASPENNWREKLFPHLPERNILVDDGTGNTLFYEGLSQAGQSIPYGAWAEPLMWWAIFLTALYLSMISLAVILRRQWIERERLAYPIAQVGLAMISREGEKSLVNGFFKRPAVWIGCALPLFFGSLKALGNYNQDFPAISLFWYIPFFGDQLLILSISFALIGFSYLINTRIAASIWIFFLFSKLQKEVLVIIGLKSDQVHFHGVNDSPLLGYEGLGALLVMVLTGLWTARGHLTSVWLKALGRAPQVDDRDEILSYRSAVFGSIAGIAVMSIWLWIMGTPLWVSFVFIVVAMLIFIGITRIITEAGLAALRAPITAPDFIVQGLGSALVGPTGVVNLSLAYIWSSEVRAFAMATCANALRLINEMDLRSRRLVFWAMILALLIGTMGSCWMIFHAAYEHGGINLNGWFFNYAPAVAYDNAVRNLEPEGIYWPGMGFLLGGAAAMALLLVAYHRLPWWPLHPIGFPIASVDLLNQTVLNVFIAWLIKVVVLKYGGSGFYLRSRDFFLGMIAGQMLVNGVWLVIDYFTGMMQNFLFGM